MEKNAKLNFKKTMKFICILYLFFFLEISSCDGVKSKYIKFSNQLGPPLEEATNFATLRSEGSCRVSSSRFTICGSIYIGFVRGRQTFYIVRRNRKETIWFSLTIYDQDTAEEAYILVFFTILMALC